MDRNEHLAWAKQRALKEVDAGRLADAVASMISDLMKEHPESAAGYHILAEIGLLETLSGPGAVRRWIEGFN